MTTLTSPHDTLSIITIFFFLVFLLLSFILDQSHRPLQPVPQPPHCSSLGHSTSRAPLHCSVSLGGRLPLLPGCITAAPSPSLSALHDEPRDTAAATAKKVSVYTGRATAAHNMLHQLSPWPNARKPQVQPINARELFFFQTR